MIHKILGITLGIVLSMCSAVVSGQSALPLLLHTSEINSKFHYPTNIEVRKRYSFQPINVKYQLNGVDEESDTDRQSNSRRRLLWIGLGVLIVGGALAGGGASDDDDDDDDNDLPPPVDDIPPSPQSQNVTSAEPKNSGSREIDTIKDRVDLNNPQRGIFLSVGGNSIDKRQSDRTRESTTGTTQFAIGYDQHLNAKTLVGALIDISSSEITFSTTEDTTEGTRKSILLFANYQRNESLAITGYIGGSALNIDNTRFPDNSALSFTNSTGDPVEVLNVTQTRIEGTTSGTVRQTGVSFSKGVQLPQSVQFDAHIDIDYSSTDIESYSEVGNSGVELQFPEQTASTISYKLGVQLSKAVSFRSGVVVPQVGIEFINESNKRRTANLVLLDDQNIQSELEPEPTDDSYSLASIGLVYVNASRAQLFGKLQKSFGHSFEDRAGVSAGIRIAF